MDLSLAVILILKTDQLCLKLGNSIALLVCVSCQTLLFLLQFVKLLSQRVDSLLSTLILLGDSNRFLSLVLEILLPLLDLLNKLLRPRTELEIHLL